MVSGSLSSIRNSCGIQPKLQRLNLYRFARRRAQYFVQHGEKAAAVAGGTPFAVAQGEVVAAAFGGNPQLLVRRVAVYDNLRAVIGLDGEHIAVVFAVEIGAALVELVFDVGKQLVGIAQKFGFVHDGLCTAAFLFKMRHLATAACFRQFRVDDDANPAPRPCRRPASERLRL